VNRTVAIVVAAVVSILSGAGLYLYVTNADERAAADEKLVAIYVAAAPISDGMTWADAFNAGAVVEEVVPQRLVPPTAVRDANELVGYTSITDIPVGIPMVAEMWASPEQLAEIARGPDTLARTIPKGRVAVTFAASAAAAVADLIQVGDKVNLIIKVPSGDAAALADGEAAAMHVFQNLEVFAIGTTVATPEGEEEAVSPGGGGDLYTVLVDAEDAARLVFLTTEYQVFLVLVPPDNEARQIPVITGANAMPESLTPGEVTEP
jgi:Flp pilus assembly protein CpaB